MKLRNVEAMGSLKKKKKVSCVLNTLLAHMRRLKGKWYGYYTSAAHLPHYIGSKDS
jgi:hypothetical protein